MTRKQMVCIMYNNDTLKASWWKPNWPWSSTIIFYNVAICFNTALSTLYVESVKSRYRISLIFPSSLVFPYLGAHIRHTSACGGHPIVISIFNTKHQGLGKFSIRIKSMHSYNHKLQVLYSAIIICPILIVWRNICHWNFMKSDWWSISW